MSEESKLIKYLASVGVFGGVIVIISTFLPWFSDYNMYDMYVWSNISGLDPDSFVYFFPIMSGIICAVGSILYVLRPYLKINSLIIELIGLGFNLLFLLDFIADHAAYLLSIQYGFYLFIVGLALIFIEVIVKLQKKEEGPDLTIPEAEEAKMEEEASLKKVDKEVKEE